MLLGWCLVVLVSSTYGLGNDGCQPNDVDVMDLTEMNIFQTVSFQNSRITEEVLENEMKRERLPADYTNFIKTREAFQLELEQGTTSVEYGETISNSDDEVDEATSLAHRAYLYYQPVCPYRYYVLQKYKWFFYYSGQSTKYCWPYYNVYGTSCTSRYCNWSYRNHNLTTWVNHYRCFPEYRTIWIFARCLTRTGDTWEWSNEFVRRAVPRGCSCRKLSLTFSIAKQCPADERPTLQ